MTSTPSIGTDETATVASDAPSKWPTSLRTQWHALVKALAAHAGVDSNLLELSYHVQDKKALTVRDRGPHDAENTGNVMDPTVTAKSASERERVKAIENANVPNESARTNAIASWPDASFTASAINTGDEDLKLYTIYAPPEHRDGTVHKTKAEADAADEHRKVRGAVEHEDAVVREQDGRNARPKRRSDVAEPKSSRAMRMPWCSLRR